MRTPCDPNIPITLPYGVKDKLHPNGHNGVDYSGRFNRTVYAPEAGTLGYQWQPTLGGNVLTLKAGNREHRLAHLSTMLQKSGSVSEGQALGQMGQTGLATAVHLHHGCLQGGAYINPLSLLQSTQKENMRKAIPPTECVKYYKNFVGIDLAPTDPACQNRFEDTTDDEYFYGVALQLRNVRLANEATISSMTESVKRLEEISVAKDVTLREKEKAYQEEIERLKQEVDTQPDPASQPPVEKLSLLQVILNFLRGKK